MRREEVAELAGITSAWYTQLETGCDIRVSPRVLDRIALVLRLSDEEKVYLFSLAIDELAVIPPTLRQQSREVLEAFRPVRSLSRRLWAATTVDEALTIAREHCATTFAPYAMFSTVHMGLGKWDVQGTGDDTAVRRTLEVGAYIVSNWAPSLRDEVHLFGILKQPGDVLTRSETAPSLDLVSYFTKTLEAVHWPTLDSVMAAVHSRNGLVARLTGIYENQQTYAKTDLAMLGAIADLTSFALADACGCVV